MLPQLNLQRAIDALKKLSEVAYITTGVGKHIPSDLVSATTHNFFVDVSAYTFLVYATLKIIDWLKPLLGRLVPWMTMLISRLAKWLLGK